MMVDGTLIDSVHHGGHYYSRSGTGSSLSFSLISDLIRWAV